MLIRVKACGICGSDVHGYTGQTGRRIPPIIMGHEAAGVIEEVGAEVSDLSRGERVCFDSTVYCNQCEPCRSGQYNRCQKRQVLGVSVAGMKRQGAFADLVTVPSWIVSKLPEGLSFTQATLLEPLSIAVHAVNRAPSPEGKTVLILGAGTIGLLILQAVQLKGAGTIIVSDLNEQRLELARQFGTSLAVNPRTVDLLGLVQDETDGQGADIVFEAVGIRQTLQQAVAATRMGGHITLVGNLESRVEMNPQEIVSRELTISGSYANAGEYRQCIDLLSSGKIDVETLISEVLPLSEGQAAFDRLHKAEENLLKVILEP